MKRQLINKIVFNDGRLELETDVMGNYVMRAIGETAHKYLYKFWKVETNNLPKVFEMFNNCELVV